jgi:acetylglutamate kinase
MIVVCKAGGELLDDPGLVSSRVAALRAEGARVVLVHGGGPQLDRAAEAAGLVSERVAGRRITSAALIDLAVAEWRGRASVGWVRALQAADVPAVGLSGVDGAWLRARRRPPVPMTDDDGVSREVDFGEVGDVAEVDPTLLLAVASHAVPVVTPLAWGPGGSVLNVNADTVAAEVAIALQAAALVLLTRAPGILRDVGDPASLVRDVDLAGLDALEAAGALKAGMRPKVAAVRRALRGGVGRAEVGRTVVR